MLRFNLLPLEFRKRFIFTQKVRKALWYRNIFLGLLAILSLFLIFMLVYLQKQRDFFLEELGWVKEHPQNIAIERIKQDIESFNNQLKYLFSASPSPDWPSYLIEIATLAPQEISLSLLVVQGSNPNPQVRIEGTAPRREHLIQFEKALRSSRYFTNVVSPLANYAKTSDIAFQLSFTLK